MKKIDLWPGQAFTDRVSKFGIWQRICPGFLQGEAVFEAAPYFLIGCNADG